MAAKMASASASLSSPLRVQRAEEKVLASGRVEVSSAAFNAFEEGQSGGLRTESNASMDPTAMSIPDLSFATDLLFNLDDVRADCAAGLVTHSSLVALLKSRISLERTYAQELRKMAKYSRLEEAEHGTMKEALGALKAQYLNTSVQHNLLAKNLEEDVLRPIETLYAYNSQKTQSLARCIHGIKKGVKVHEDAYKKDFGVFDKHFRDACATFSAAMATGFSSTSLECQYHQRLSQMERGECLSNNVTSTHARRHSGTVALKSLNNNSHKLVNWLRSSEQHRKEHLANNAVKVLETAEMSRRKCRQSWQEVEEGRIEMCVAIQSVLTDYQQLAENRIFSISTNLRKHVIFASSALANEQYDCQMLANKLESIDLEGDIRDFILQGRPASGSSEWTFTHLTVNDLCNSAACALVASPSSKPCRPLTKAPLEIRDLASRKIPFDGDCNQELLCELLVTRASSMMSAQPQGRGRPASALPSRENYDELRIDCRLSPPQSTERGSTRSPAHRVVLASDVAKVIARFQEARAQRKYQKGDGGISDPSEGCEPENNSDDLTLSCGHEEAGAPTSFTP